MVQCRFTSTETIGIIRDGEPRTATSTFTQLLNSVLVWPLFFILNYFIYLFINIVLFSALKQTHCDLVSCDFERLTAAFIARFLISTKVANLQRYLVVTWLVPRETAAVSVHILCTPFPCQVTIAAVHNPFRKEYRRRAESTR